MSSKYNVSVIIINYNGKRFIDQLFRSFMKMRTDGITYEIIVVNNGNEDHSIEYLKEHYGGMKQLKIVETGENKGYAGGNNAGADLAEGEYLIFLNNDTAVDENWLVSLYRSMKEMPACGILNSKLLFFYDYVTVRFETTNKVVLSSKIRINQVEYQIDAKFCKNLVYESDKLSCFFDSEIAVPLRNGVVSSQIEFFCMEDQGKQSSLVCCNRRAKLKNHAWSSISLICKDLALNKYSLIQNAGSDINEYYNGYDIGMGERDAKKYQQKYEITCSCGASMMISKEDFIKCGRFDEKFFMYYEDVDLSFRVRKMGKKIMFCPESVVRHIHTGSSVEWSPFFCYQVSRNKLLFLLKHMSWTKFIYWFLRQSAASIRHRNKYQLMGCMDAVQVGLLGKDIKFYDKQKK